MAEENTFGELDNSFVDFDSRVRKALEPKPLPKVSERITLYSYLANRVPADAHFVLNKYGRYRKARNERELEYQLKDFVRSFGAKGLMALSEIHPDRQLVEKEWKACQKKEQDYTHLLAQHNTTSQQQAYFNASGTGKEDRMIQKFNYNLIIMGAFVLMGVALLMKNKKI